ncbi:MAG: chemotaxis protein CheB [Colwellia sp.]|nr:chemotaxis protein CheB [Colwellia sp.]
MIEQMTTHQTKKEGYTALVIGVSAGGLAALELFLPQLPKLFSLAIIVLQHRGQNSVKSIEDNDEDFLVDYFKARCTMPVLEATMGDKIKTGHIYIAPVQYHLLIEQQQTFSFSLEPPVNYARPSIDVLFESASHCYKNQLIGLILTGASSDGSQGLKMIKLNGGLTIVQEPSTAEASFMPTAAIASHKVDYILPLKDISTFLINFTLKDQGDD